MGFKLVGFSNQFSGVVEISAGTAYETIQLYHDLIRRCGSRGKVEIWQNNRQITETRLLTRVRKEALAGGLSWTTDRVQRAANPKSRPSKDRNGL